MTQVIKYKETRFERGVRLAQTGHNIRKIPKVLGSQLWKVESERVKDKWYDVVLFQDGNVFCSCEDSMYSGEVCKHVFSVIASETLGEIKKEVIEE